MSHADFGDRLHQGLRLHLNNRWKSEAGRHGRGSLVKPVEECCGLCRKVGWIFPRENFIFDTCLALPGVEFALIERLSSVTFLAISRLMVGDFEKSRGHWCQ